MHLRGSVATTLAALIVLTLLPVAEAAGQTPDVQSSTGAYAADQSAGAQASYKRQVEAVEFNTRSVSQRLVSAAESQAGSSAVGGSAARASSSTALPGCYNHIVSAGAGELNYGHICPGYGGYQGGATAELFGTGEIVLRDPTTGEITGTIPADGLTTDTTTTVTVTSSQLAQFALADMALPAPSIETNPDGDHLVQLPSWLWIDPAQWEPTERTASAGPVSATVTAAPVRVDWDMGDGATVTCDGPGIVYERHFAEDPNATDCKHTYRHSSAGKPGDAYSVTATIAWQVAWTGSDGDGGDFGELTSDATEDIRVQEAQALVQ